MKTAQLCNKIIRHFPLGPLNCLTSIYLFVYRLRLGIIYRSLTYLRWLHIPRHISPRLLGWSTTQYCIVHQANKIELLSWYDAFVKSSNIVIVCLQQSFSMSVIFQCCVAFLLIAAVCQHRLYRWEYFPLLLNRWEYFPVLWDRWWYFPSLHCYQRISWVLGKNCDLQQSHCMNGVWGRECDIFQWFIISWNDYVT